MSDLRFTVQAKEEKYAKYAEALEWWLNRIDTLGKLLPNLLVEYARYELRLVTIGTDGMVPNRSDNNRDSKRIDAPSLEHIETTIEEFFPTTQPTTNIKYILNEPGTYCEKHDTTAIKQIINFDTERFVDEFCQVCEPNRLMEIMPHVAKFTRSSKVPSTPKELHPRSQAERESFKVE